MMQGDDPPFLPVGTDVSAKYKGAFCEAKVKKVVRNIKCKVTLKAGGGTITVNDDVIKGTLRVGSTVEVKQDPKKEGMEAVIAKIQDCSQYTVVFDDGDITTLRRSALCLKSGRHFNESETLDQLPLTHPEHFSTPVLAGRRGRRGRAQSEESEGEAPIPPAKSSSSEREPHVGRVVLVESGSGGERRRPAQPAFPALVVAPTAQIKVKEDYLVRSFKDGRYYTVPKKEAREFRKGSAPLEWAGVEAALQYLNNGVLPPHWDRDALFNEPRNTSDDSSDDEPREEKDHFVAQLYKFMDDRGTPLNRNPTIANKDIDLYRLFRVVQKLGGYNRVTNQNQWKTIADKMGFHPVTTTITNLCKQAYKKFLYSFEDFYRKLGVTLVAHPRGNRTPPSGRSLIRDRDKQLLNTSPAGGSTPQRVKDKDSEKSETEKSEKEDKPEREKREKSKEEAARASDDGEDSTDNQPLVVPSKVNKDKEKEKEIEKEREKEKEKEKEIEKEKEKEKEKERVKKKEEEREKEKEKEKELEKIEEKPGVKSRSQSKTRSLPPLKTRPEDSRTPKTRRPMSSRAESVTPSTSRASRRPHASTDSDSSGRASRCGMKKLQSRRSQSANSASSGNTVASGASGKRARKRKTTEPSTSETPARAGGALKAQVGDKLKVFYGPTQTESKVTYEAKVTEVSAEGALRVHYTGWNTRYDEWIKPQRIALNVTQHERMHSKKGSGSSRRVRAKRTEESSARSDSSDTDSEIDVKRPPKKLDEKSSTRSSLRQKDSKSSDSSSSSKPRKRPIRTLTTPTSITPIKKSRPNLSGHQGRDYDLNEIRSELKGLHTVKQEPEEVKKELTEKEIKPELTVPPKQEKQAEDVYEFKEPEPFEIELHDEKKKRTHRIFDDISPSKYTSTLSKSLSEEISEDPLRARPVLRSPSRSPFREYSAREAPGRQSPVEDSKDCLFSMDDDSFPGEGSSGPIFEGFTPAKNQETYSKKKKVLKLRELIDDSPDSPADDEQSSDDETGNTGSKEDSAHQQSSSATTAADDTSNTLEKVKEEKKEVVTKPESPVKELAMVSPIKPKVESPKAPNTPPLLTVEVKDDDEEDDEEELPIIAIKTSCIPLPSAMSVASIPLPSTDPKPVENILLDESKSDSETMSPKKLSDFRSKTPSPLMDTEEEKSEPDSPVRIDALPDPPPGFLLHSEGPKIAEKLLKAINSAKRLSASPPPAEARADSPEDLLKLTTTKPEKNVSPLPEIKLSMSPINSPMKDVKMDIQDAIFGEPSAMSDSKRDVTEVKKVKPKEPTPPRLTSPLSSLGPLILERRPSGADLSLPNPGKNNKVLSDTIQKLSSQINQSTANIPLPPFPPAAAERRESTDSDDDDDKLVIEAKTSESWSATAAAATALAHAGKSAGEWSAGESLLMLEDACKKERKHSASVVVAGSGTGTGAARGEDDSSLSLLLCSETIPGSPAPPPAPDAEPPPPPPRRAPPFASAAAPAPPPAQPRNNTEERASEPNNRQPPTSSGAAGAGAGAGAGGAARAGWGRLLEHTPPTTPDSSLDMSPLRYRRMSERDSPPRKEEEEEHRQNEALPADTEKPHVSSRSRKASESSCAGGAGGAGGAAGRRARRARRDTDTEPAPHAPHAPLKYNFYVELDPSWDSPTRINVLTSRLAELRKAYHNVKAELAAVDRRRKKLRRKEREAVKAAKAACS